MPSGPPDTQDMRPRARTLSLLCSLASVSPHPLCRMQLDRYLVDLLELVATPPRALGVA
jgi:hypothetical protein